MPLISGRGPTIINTQDTVHDDQAVVQQQEYGEDEGLPGGQQDVRRPALLVATVPAAEGRSWNTTVEPLLKDTPEIRGTSVLRTLCCVPNMLS